MTGLKYTLQINLSPGDLPYATKTVPALIRAHQGEVTEVLLIVDCCKPQLSTFVNPDLRFPMAEFNEKVAAVKLLAEGFLKERLVDRLEFLSPQDQRIQLLSKKFTAGIVNQTHDCGGCGLMSYFLGLHECKTPYLLHYDADMLLYQAEAYSWAREAINTLLSNQEIIFVRPRPAPPVSSSLSAPPSIHEGRPYSETDSGFVTDWFSTRCFMADIEALNKQLPLIDINSKISLMLRKLFFNFSKNFSMIRMPAYPPSPEIMLHRHLSKKGLKSLYLNSLDAFTLHPIKKTDIFLNKLSSIIERASINSIPEEQKGFEDLKLEFW